MITIATILAIGLLTGILSGLLGIGGGVVIVPMLVMIVGVSQHMAQGISMLVIIPTALVGIWHFQQKKLVDFQIAAYLALGAVCGALLSANFVQYIPGAYLKQVFGVFVILTGIHMIFGKAKAKTKD